MDRRRFLKRVAGVGVATGATLVAPISISAKESAEGKMFSVEDMRKVMVFSSGKQYERSIMGGKSLNPKYDSKGTPIYKDITRGYFSVVKEFPNGKVDVRQWYVFEIDKGLSKDKVVERLLEEGTEKINQFIHNFGHRFVHVGLQKPLVTEVKMENHLLNILEEQKAIPPEGYEEA